MYSLFVITRYLKKHQDIISEIDNKVNGIFMGFILDF